MVYVSCYLIFKCKEIKGLILNLLFFEMIKIVLLLKFILSRID